MTPSPWSRFIPGLLLLLMLPPPAAGAQTILDCYQSVPERILDHARYSLQLEKGRWTTRSAAGYALEPLVDIDSSYLRIADPGTGGGSLVQELALFRTGRGGPILGVNLTRFDGVGSECRLAFYDPGGGLWRDVTRQVLPTVDLSLFLADTYDANRIKPDRGVPGIALLYLLPRTGTTLRVRIELDRLILTSAGPQDRAVAEIVNSIKYGEVQLPWDEAGGRFTVGDRTPFEPTDLARQYLGGPPASAGAEQTGVERQPAAGADAPAADNPERRAILEALLRALYSESGLDIVLDLPYLRISRGWAWFHAQPRTRDGRVRLEDVSGLMQRGASDWQVAEIRSADAEDAESSDDAAYFRGLLLRWPSVPPQILPR